MAIEDKIQPGLILLADAFLKDANFKRSVILLSEIQEKGYVGFILNRPLNVQLSDAIPEFKGIEAPLFYGGPVQTDTMHFFHKLGDKIEDSIEIIDGVYWGGNFDQVKELLIEGTVQPNEFKFFLGYAGWDKGQLVNELKDKAWIIDKGTFNHVFSEDTDNLWANILNNKGGKFKLFAGFPEDPMLN